MAKKQPHALILFARVPALGKVKTRLESLLDQETVFQLYKHFLDDSIEKIRSVKGVDSWVGVYPPQDINYFQDIASQGCITVITQEGDDLGDRMRNTIAQRLREDYEKVIIIGSDSPSLPVTYIEKAFQSDKDIVIGPSTDRGYYLIGMNRVLFDIFDGVPWGTENVLDATLERVKQVGASLELLPVWYDVDRPEDLRFLKVHLDLLDHSGQNELSSTREFLNQLDL
ncbi:MAG: TIGR04282 family arsenosugar biosynthesis glycosyltransferase [Nitrospinales bacterium]